MTFGKPAIALLLSTALAGPAFAVGDEDETPPKPTETTTECADGLVYDPKTETCLEPQNDAFNDDDRYRAVREFAYAGRYDDALRVLATADNPHDPRMLNYTGFVHRKLGRMDEAMAYYRAALEIDPDYSLARSYMGQGLVATGRIDEARLQLLEISARGGEGGWPYLSLSHALRRTASTY